MTRPKVYLTRAIAKAAVARLKSIADVDVWAQEGPPPKEIILQKIKDIDGLVTLLTDPIDSEVINAAGPNLKVISQMAVGFDNIDINAATLRDLPVGHTPGVLTETCADFTWALLLAAARRVSEGDREVRSGIWKPWGPDILTGPDVFGATLGLVGFGRIGQAVARRARGFNMRVLYNDLKRYPEMEDELGVTFASLDELLAQADFVSVHTFLAKETRHLFNRSTFEKMKPTAIFLNTARGPIVDPDALTWALQEKKIAAAGIDVFEPEPIPAGHPILSLPNIIVTPHIASGSIQTREKMANITVDNLVAGLDGRRLLYCANPDVYRHS
jgi:glyoxylate reductase